MDVSIMIEGQMGLNWQRWQRIARAVEDLGFAGLFRSDHFTNPSPPDEDSLEMITALTYLASATRRIRFGPLVAPVSFRDPVMLARQAAAIGDLSGGRMVLGVGMGWQDREHEMFGYTLGDVPTRAARLTEAVELCARLLRDDDPVTFEGRFFRVRDASITPRPPRPVPVQIGGNGQKVTLPLVARWCDGWNAIFLGPEDFAARNRLLDELLEKNGRAPGDVRRSMMTGVFPGLGGQDLDRVRARGAIAGSDAQMNEQLEQLAAAGCDEIMLQWLALDDLDGLGKLAASLPLS